MLLKNAKIRMLLLLLVITSAGYAENLGVYGSIYPITEPDFLSLIHQQLLIFKQDGRLDDMQKSFEKKVQEKALRPTPVEGVATALKSKTFYETPSFTLSHNIYDAKGNLIFKAGTRVNPLDQTTIATIAPNTYVPMFNETLLFINADDQSQLRWAQANIKTISENNHIFKVILVNGNLKTTSNMLGRIYFDQKGTLCRQFKIRAVPAIVTRAGARLKIEEFALQH